MIYFLIIVAVVFLTVGGYVLDDGFRKIARVQFQVGGILMFAGVVSVLLLVDLYELSLLPAFLLLALSTSAGYIIRGLREED